MDSMENITYKFSNQSNKQKMNRAQRQDLKRMAVYLTELSHKEDVTLEELQSMASESAGEVEMMADEEQDKLDNMPENLAFSSRADDYQDNIDALYDIMSTLRDVEMSDTLEEARQDIASAVGMIYNLVD